MRDEVETRRQQAPEAHAIRGVLAPLHVECVGADVAAAFQTAWSDLCRRSLEPNVFLEPSFALTLMQHLPSRRPPRFLLVWERNGPASYGRLVGLLALRLPRHGGVVHGFTHKFVALGTPLLDRDRSHDAFSALLSWLRGQARPMVALVLQDVILGEAFHATVTRGAPFGVHVLDRRLRAILRRIVDEGAAIPFGSAKRRKELRRRQRRLSERGVRSYSSARSTADVAFAAERFLALEHDGWKGERGTALLAAPASAAFTRTMTRLMAEQGKCRIDAAEVDAKPVGMGIILTSGDRAFFWKTTFDESLAALSPGVQFAFDLTAAQLADPEIAATDSCAVPEHSMINRLWRDRVAIGDVMIALEPVPSVRFRQAVRRERLGRALRAKARQLRQWWRTRR